jgi:hypothetical protein
MYNNSKKNVSGINPSDGINLEATLAKKLASKFIVQGIGLILKA